MQLGPSFSELVGPFIVDKVLMATSVVVELLEFFLESLIEEVSWFPRDFEETLRGVRSKLLQDRQDIRFVVVLRKTSASNDVLNKVHRRLTIRFNPDWGTSSLKSGKYRAQLSAEGGLDRPKQLARSIEPVFFAPKKNKEYPECASQNDFGYIVLPSVKIIK